jgi:hypothetical protein
MPSSSRIKKNKRGTTQIVPNQKPSIEKIKRGTMRASSPTQPTVKRRQSQIKPDRQTSAKPKNLKFKKIQNKKTILKTGAVFKKTRR